MIISHGKRFVLLTPWKCASSTLHHRLGTLSESPYPRFYSFNPFLNRVVHQHLTCAEFEALPEAKVGYRRAAFVRSPYDRVFSGFRQLRRDTALIPQAEFSEPWIKALVLRQLAECRRQLAEAGYDFNAWVASLREDQVREIGGNSSLPLYPSHYWTHVAGNRAVDFIGRVEDFERDFDRLCIALDIPIPTPVDADAFGKTRAASDRTVRTEERTGLMSRATIDKINALFTADFDLFGYDKR
jgi:hypothetical protein